MSALVQSASQYPALHAAFTEARRRARVGSGAVLAAVSWPVQTPSPLELFGAWHDARTSCVYWRSQQPALELFGWDACLELCGHDEHRFADIDRAWRALQAQAVVHGECSPRLLGGFGFDPQRNSEAQWRHFPAARMAAPRLLLSQDADGQRLLCQHLVEADDDPGALAAQYCAWADALAAPEPCSDSDIELLGAEETSSAHWRDGVERALAEIRQRRLHKVVLARQVRYSYARSLNPAQVLQRLSDMHGNAHVFAVAHQDCCFLGATPERLVRLEHGVLRTHALAGSTRRGVDEREDQALGEALLASAKDRQEHAMVVDAIRAVLAPRAQQLESPALPGLHRLPNIQHLNTPFQARLRDGVGLLETIQALHPTPAVAGLDRDAAMLHIRDHEGFDRGWYAAPIGWLDGAGGGDFAVALRSALIDGATCYLFAGCGIVADSDPDSEYRETCLKLAPMRAALSIEAVA
ncbi:isochorismate synthase [Pseudomonas sp. CGJS7]|uniref:isochorismate synthase n=1 Tax=Pseudomonas sp. CGJS7 TaxID=3109348 RepID=UPI003008DF75